jgi:hypothetical protein
LKPDSLPVDSNEQRYNLSFLLVRSRYHELPLLAAQQVDCPEFHHYGVSQKDITCLKIDSLLLIVLSSSQKHTPKS